MRRRDSDNLTELRPWPLPGASSSSLSPSGFETEPKQGLHESSSPTPRRRRKVVIWIWVGVFLAVATAAAIIVGVLLAKNVIHVGSSSPAAESAVSTASTTATGDSGSPTATPTRKAGSATTTTGASASSTPTAMVCSTKDSIPKQDQGTYLDPTTWLDMAGFNCTYTSATVGGLPLVGLNSTWDDSAQANPNVPALDVAWGSYTSRPARGVNLGGWLSLEPFITPTLFNGNVDEYSLCKQLGSDAAATLEKHYSTFITEQDIKGIADAGLDHVRIPFSYWAVQTYDGDPYVAKISWRYLLRAIEWCRKYGIRVNLDLHALPGSQNGWNHSGRQGTVDFISGPDGSTNAQRGLDLHNQLSKFFAQDRYKNIIAFYGLANEPAKSIDQAALVSWTTQAFNIVRGNGISAPQIFSESLRGLPAWQGQLQGHGDSLIIDAHNYAIFDNGLISTKHAGKVSLACSTWSGIMSTSMNTATGFGPTIAGEWSQADTDCAKYVNGVGNGARWTGTFSDTNGQPQCPTKDQQCTCDQANADPSTFSDGYKLFLKTWAQAQMDAFEKSWGWFYWTWKTESSPLWSYQAGLAGGFMPAKAYARDWDCSKPIPSFGDLPEYY